MHEPTTDRLVCDQARLPPVGLLAGCMRTDDNVRAKGRWDEDVPDVGWDPEVRMEALRTDGVTGEVLYPTIAMQMYPIQNASAGIENSALNGLDVDIWATDPSGLGSSIGANVDPESARGVITASAMTNGQVYRTDPRFKECLDAFNARHPDIEVKHPDTLEEGEPLWFTALSGHCRFFQIFEYLATEAGPNLTHETFAAAIENAGQFSVAGQPYASLGPGKLSSNDSFQLVAQDPDLDARGELVPIGPMRDATP